MDIDEIETQWLTDSEIDIADLATETQKTAKLHGKYYAYYRSFARDYDKRKLNRSRLLKLKTDYYSGELSKEELERRGWKPFQKRLLKTDMSVYLAADDDMITADLKLAEVNRAVEFLESIIKSINNRGHHVRNVLEFLKFKNGGY